MNQRAPFSIRDNQLHRADGQALRDTAALVDLLVVASNEGNLFHDLADVPHTVFENADSHRSLIFVIGYTVRKGAPVIEIP